MTDLARLLPFHILSIRVLDDGDVGIDATTAQGRIITAVVPRWNSTAEGIQEALCGSAAAQLDADAALVGVLASYAADEKDPYAVDDTDIDAAAG